MRVVSRGRLKPAPTRLRAGFTRLILLIALAAPLAGQAPAPGAQAPPRVPPRDPLAAAPAPTGSGRIRGRIVEAGTRTPLRRAQVTLAGDQNVQRQVTSDAEGRYEFSDLPPGRFTVTAAKGGYLTMQYGQRRAFEPGRQVELAAAQVLERADLVLPRGGVITGRVTDRFGEPAVGAEIAVERYQYAADGQRRLTRVSVGTPVAANDLGEFRVFGLMPGEYVVSANIRQRPPFPGSAPTNAPTVGYLATYHPGTANVADSEPVLVELGAEASVQFTMVSGRMSRVSGTITDSTGQPARGANLTLATAATNPLGASGRSAESARADGTFTITNVPPGDHFVQVRLAPRPGGPAEPEFANVPVSASGDEVTGLQITTAPAAIVPGVVEWEGTTARTRDSSVPLRITAAGTDGRPQFIGLIGAGDPSANGSVSADNTFRIGGLFGSVRFTATGVPSQWMLKGVFAGNGDVTDVGTDVAGLDANRPLRIVLTDKLTQLSGSVRNAQGQPATEYVVVVLPEQPVDPAVASRYTQALRPDQKGVFHGRALPPGRYVAAAVDALEAGNEWDPAFQATVRNGGQRFTLTEGQALTLALELMP